MSQSKTPECRRCNTQSIIADAGMLTYKPYFYCRNCKIELDFYGYEKRVLKNVADETPSEQLPESADEKWGSYIPGYVTFDSSLGGSWPNGVIKFEKLNIGNSSPISIEYSDIPVGSDGQVLWHPIKTFVITKPKDSVNINGNEVLKLNFSTEDWVRVTKAEVKRAYQRDLMEEAVLKATAALWRKWYEDLFT